MRKMAIGAWSFALGPFASRPLSLHTVLHALEDVGIGGLELGAFLPHPTPENHETPEKRRRLRQEAADHGITFSALLPDLRAQHLISLEDPSPFVVAVERNLTFAEDLGIDTVILDTVEPAGRLTQLGIDGREALDRVATAFDLCARRARDRGLRLAWEFDPSRVINSPEAVATLAARLRSDHPHFGLLYDTCNGSLCARIGGLPGGERELIRSLRDYVIHVHLSDSDGMGRHLPPGQGKLAFESLIQELSLAPALGPWGTVDLGEWPEAFDAIAESKRFLNKVYKKLGLS